MNEPIIRPPTQLHLVDRPNPPTESVAHPPIGRQAQHTWGTDPNGDRTILRGSGIAVLIESAFYEREIAYYRHRFAEEEAHLHFMSRLRGSAEVGINGHEHCARIEECTESFEDIDDVHLREHDVIIVLSEIVGDRLRYTEDVNRLPPATQFLTREFAEAPVLSREIILPRHVGSPHPHPHSSEGAGSRRLITCTATCATWERSTSTRI